MLKKNYVVIADSEAEIYRLMRVASNNHLYSAYKIGVYGSERQHELLVTGYPWDYHKFLNEVNPACKKKELIPEGKA